MQVSTTGSAYKHVANSMIKFYYASKDKINKIESNFTFR